MQRQKGIEATCGGEREVNQEAEWEEARAGSSRILGSKDSVAASDEAGQESSAEGARGAVPHNS